MAVRIFLAVLLLLVGTSLLGAQGQAPNITVQPSDQLNISIGTNATFSVTASGEGLMYQWQKGDVLISDIVDTYSGTNTASLTVLSVNITDEGSFSCNVSNINGSDVSQPAQLDVVAVCPSLSNPVNGMVNTSSEIEEGMTATYTCDMNYTLAGMTTRTCGADGTWSGTEPTCTPTPCSDLMEPPNGGISYNNGTTGDRPVGTVATYSCDNNYTLNGDSTTRTCQLGQMYSGSAPTCEPTPCSDLMEPLNGGISYNGGTTNSRPVGTVATYNCTQGYTLNGGSTTRTCQLGQMYSGSAPTCEPVECGPSPNVTNGMVSFTNTTFESTATYSCDTGYVLMGNMTRTCGADGNYTGSTPTCDLFDCGNLTDPMNGMVMFTATTFGSTATYSCDTGYDLNGTTTRTCQCDGTCESGGWNGSAPTCDPVECGSPPALMNGMPAVTGTTFGSTANYSCNTGYTLNDTNTLSTCQANAMWSVIALFCQLSAPMITQQPMNSSYLVPGESAEFTVVSSGLELTYQWMDNGGPLDDVAGRYEGTNTSVLRVLSVTDADNGAVYSCVVSNSAGSDESDDASLLILSLPDTPMLSMDPVTGVGMSTAISCVGSSDDGNITLSITTNAPGGRSVALTMSGSILLLVNNATVDDRGVYTCVAANRRGSVSQNTTLYVVDIQISPPMTVPSGNNVTFSCSADGAPSSSNTRYFWRETILNVELAARFPALTQPRVSGENSSMLTITNLIREDEGDYACYVNVNGVNVGRATTRLNVTLPTLVVGLPANVTLNATETLALTCVGENPSGALSPLYFRWVANGVLLEEADSRINNTLLSPNGLRSVFTIENVMTTDSGEYTCTLYNRLPLQMTNGQRSSADVRVFFTPELTFPGAPFTFQAGTSADITCRVISVPPPTSFELVELNPDGSVRSRESGSGTEEREQTIFIRINPIMLNKHNRTFVCNATNANGGASNSTIITVFGVPGEIDHTDITSTPVSLLSRSFTFSPPVDNNSPITSYSVILCELSCDPNQPSPLPVDTFQVPGSTRLMFTLGGILPPNRLHLLRVLGVNAGGNGMVPFANQSFMFNSSTQADGTPVELMVEPGLITGISVVLSWVLPPLASQPNITASQFMVTWRQGEEVLNTTNVIVRTDSRQGFVLTGLLAGLTYSVEVVAIYSVPILTSTEASIDVTTLEAAPPPLVNTPPTPSTNDGQTLAISWMPPAPTPLFFTRYRVTYSAVSTLNSRRKRQDDMGTNFTTNNQFTIPDPEPLADYIFNVDAEILPDGSSSPIFIPVTPPFMVTSSPQSPNEPTDVEAIPSTNGNPYRAIDVTWTHPSMPGGILVRCVINLSDSSSSINVIVSPPMGGGMVPEHETVESLSPGVEYMLSVHCFSGRSIGDTDTTFRGTDSVIVPVTPLVGVFQPGISAPGVDHATRRITVTITFFATYGPHDTYQLGISSEAVDFSAGGLLPLSGVNGYYVIRSGNTPQSDSDGSLPVMIGGDAQSLEPGTYSIFVRVLNSGGAFNDSIIVTATINPPFDPVPVIVPIALIAVILLVILIALLIFAVVRLGAPVRRRQYIPGEKGMTDGKGKRSNNIELRRTRLFSPMLNVGSPDVFTSAGQPTTLICEASGTPAPEVTWTKDGEPLDKERFIQLADSSLFVNETDLQDEGEYVVTAVNSAGQAEQLVKVTVLRPVPPESDEEHPPVKVGDFTEKLALLRANDDEALEDEYADIELDWTFTSYAAKLNINKNKNRYINIIPYDHARVVLSLQDNTPGSDYINGSYVDGHANENSYIATQGPIPSTFPDFWRMIWEKDSPTIVMVTNLKEEDKVKCHQYWPSYGTTTYGNIQVTLKEVENLAEYSIRTFTVTPLAGQSRAQMPVREVRQFHFLVWPDHGVPQYATALLTFRKRVIRYHPDKRGPMVVHCSAGVGRTGTFITIDVCLKQIETEGNLDIFNFVRHMRFRRNYMVQTASQYVFIHDAVLEAIMCGDNSIPAPELRTKLQALAEVNPETGKSSFAVQLDTLNAASPADDEFDCSVAQLPDNAAKNRFKEHLPSNEFRVTLSSEDDQSDYICASFVDGYRHRHNFIVTQAPLQDTVGDFWRMVWEQKSAAIIMLTQLEEGGEEMSIKYWPSTVGEAGVFGSYQLELSEDEKDKGEYITRRFKLSPVDNPQESRMVTQFHYTRWGKTTPPENAHPILDLIDELQRVQRKSGNGPITVHCDNGFGRTGAFCTLYTVLERVKAEQVVDVFQAVKTLRIQRVGLMETLEEYVFVHKAVQEFLNSFSDYQNFK